MKANGLVDTEHRISASDQQLSWAQMYEKRMRRFNLIGVSVALAAIISEFIVWWLFFQ